MKIKQTKVPIPIRRVAAQHLESLRGTELGFNVDDLYIGDVVCPIYRPDIKKPAYYEFEVLKETKHVPDNREDLVHDVAKKNFLDNTGYEKIYRNPDFPTQKIGDELWEQLQSPVQGFITVSSTEKDFPIPHWSLDHMPISLNLEKEAGRKNKKLRRIYKLDALAYVAEDKSGKEIASIGDKPSLIKKLPDDMAAFSGRINSIVPREISKSRKPDASKMKRRAFVKRGPKAPQLKLKKFSSWQTMKEDYAKSFRPMLDALKTRAKESWEVLHAIRDLGEGIKVGEHFCVPLLEKDFAINLKGETTDLVKVRVVKRPGGNAAVELFCSDESITREMEFKLYIKYGSGNEESLDFFIYKPGIPTQGKSTLEED